MIRLEVHDEEFVAWLDSLQYKIQTMVNTLTEIAKMIGKSFSAVKMRLQKGRRLLKEIYRKEYM